MVWFCVAHMNLLDGLESPVVRIVIVGGDVVGRAHGLVLRLAGGAWVRLCCLSGLVCCCCGLLPLPGAALMHPVAFLATVVALSLVAPAIAAFEGTGSGKGLVGLAAGFALALSVGLVLRRTTGLYAVCFLGEEIDDIPHLQWFAIEASLPQEL